MLKNPALFWLTAVTVLATSLAAQSSPFLPDPLFDGLIEAVSGDRAYEDVRQLTQYHRTAGSQDFFAASEWIRSRAEEAGLEDVRLIRQAWDGTNYSCLRGEAWLVSPERKKLASRDDFPLTIADGSRTTQVEGELVYAGSGTAEADYEGLDVSGKIVLASGSPGRVHRQAVWKRGALGVVSFSTSRDSFVDAPDQIAWGRIPFVSKGVEGVEDGTLGTFGIMISPRRGLELAKRLTAADEPFRVAVDIEAEVGDPSGQAEQAMVEGWIRGSEIDDQQIVLVSHIQEEVGSANDDGSGVASMLEVARALTRLIEDGILPRPRRDIRFWWVNELSSQPQYFRENPEEAKKMLIAINQDMVGARQSWGGRVQYASLNPWSTAHALDTVMQDILEVVRDSNTGLLTFRGTGQPPRFQRPILSIKGSREPFHARMIPFYGFSDHESFLIGPIGVPATALINWPDDWIHSSGDDLDNIDATQLQRNAVVVAGVSTYFATVDDQGAMELASHVSAAARTRLAADLKAALEWMVAEGGTVEARRWARNLLTHAYEREVRAVRSASALGSSDTLSAWVEQLVDSLDSERQARLSEIDTTLAAWTGSSGADLTDETSEEEQQMSQTIYRRTDDLGAYFDGIGGVDRGGLHRATAFETFNLVDGSRTALEIYEGVRAQAMAAGQWYYGTVSASQVAKALASGVEKGVLEVVSSPGD